MSPKYIKGCIIPVALWCIVFLLPLHFPIRRWHFYCLPIEAFLRNQMLQVACKASDRVILPSLCHVVQLAWQQLSTLRSQRPSLSCLFLVKVMNPPLCQRWRTFPPTVFIHLGPLSFAFSVRYMWPVETFENNSWRSVCLSGSHRQRQTFVMTTSLCFPSTQ